MSDTLFKYADDFEDTCVLVSEGPGAYVYVDTNGSGAEVQLDADAVVELRDALDEWLGEAPTISTSNPNEAKLKLAQTFGLSAKFAYQGDLDRKPVVRRLKPDTVEERGGVIYVLGQSYDEGGDEEGIRQFRLDRIHGPVAIR